MNSIWISEYSGLARIGGIVAPMTAEPSICVQVLEFGDDGSALSQPFSGKTVCVRVHSDAHCLIGMSAEPKAEMRLAADTTEYFAVVPGHKLAVKEAL